MTTRTGSVEEAQTGLLVVFFDDIVGSTSLRTELGDERYDSLLLEHESLIEELLPEGDGRLIKSTGDGTLVVFSLPLKAVEFALALQGRVRQHPMLRVRVGLDEGQVVERKAHGVSDVFGRPVNRAARAERRWCMAPDLASW